VQRVRFRSVLAIASVLALLIAAGTGWFMRKELRRPLGVPETGYVLDIPSGSTLKGVTSQLAKDEIISHPWVILAYARVAGLDAAIKAGEYEIAAGETPLGFLDKVVTGRVKLHSLTVVEGWTVRDLLRAVRKHPAIQHTLGDEGPELLVEAYSLPGGHAEGWFFPDTYHFPRGTTDIEFLGEAHRKMKAVLERAWAARAADLPLRSPYEALILGSIVEKETSLDRERPRIAGVFIRRLRNGMRLQTDPTVIYGLGEQFKGDITRRHLTQDTPYNTYTRSGLPPSPIAMPGESSLLAALHPDDSGALYFVASAERDGSHVFSSTLHEHNAAVRKYLAAARDPE